MDSVSLPVPLQPCESWNDYCINCKLISVNVCLFLHIYFHFSVSYSTLLNRIHAKTPGIIGSLRNEQKPDRAWWLVSVIQAPWEVEIGRIMVQGPPRQKVSQSPSQPGYSGARLSSQLSRKHKQDCVPYQPEPHLKNKESQKGLSEWLKW
jgi:hypothetical protein